MLTTKRPSMTQIAMTTPQMTWSSENPNMRISFLCGICFFVFKVDWDNITTKK